MLRDMLRGEGVAIGRCRVATMMKRMGITALYRRPNTSKPAPGHKIYPYLVRKLTIERPNQGIRPTAAAASISFTVATAHTGCRIPSVSIAFNASVSDRPR